MRTSTGKARGVQKPAGNLSKGYVQGRALASAIQSNGAALVENRPN
eukprot:CAMPEP_0203917962 /NCGR_PEP_ID=MMETSP0359-20131031/58531_1 /ASSEMBLY_ACC=CAM_ASM_000338 /TAXON_ID=268821 /ORGANISM="Scrippsiella Hangoei, Strain SHTV-5" /LENGTH=45 /DNA_ID= /DNA_START= /DNA_END= /DNA_ORIENTATION=